MKLSDLFNNVPGLSPDQFPDPADDIAPEANGAPQSVVLGGGCFWCTEAVFARLDGVLDVASGYAGGTAETADYNSVCSGMTDHAEVIRVRFDPARISYGQVLKVFFAVAHDPTHLNRQGNDMGRQYRSVVFYDDAAQQRVAEGYLRQLAEAKAYPDPIVTTLEPLEAFYDAEPYHQNFVARNPAQPYVRAVSMPKVEKLEKSFSGKLKRS